MKILKKWWVFVLILLASFGIDYNWFTTKNSCDLNPLSCADYLGRPDYSVYPNFTFTKVCGGISGECIPSHSMIFIQDLLITIFIFSIILFAIYIINKIFRKKQ